MQVHIIVGTVAAAFEPQLMVHQRQQPDCHACHLAQDTAVDFIELHDTGRRTISTVSQLVGKGLQQRVGRREADDLAQALVEPSLVLERDVDQGVVRPAHVKFGALSVLGIAAPRPSEVDKRDDRKRILDIVEILLDSTFQQSDQDARHHLRDQASFSWPKRTSSSDSSTACNRHLPWETWPTTLQHGAEKPRTS